MTYDTIDNDVTMPGATGAPLGRSDAAGNVFDAKSVSDAVTMAPGGGLSLGRIDQYELVRELGGGGFGSVYLAKDTVAGIEVAVKGLPPLIRNNAEELERIRENFALVSRLHHPYIAAAMVLHPAKEVCYSSEDARQKLRVMSGDTLMVMEYAPGVTLSKWRKQFPDGTVPFEYAIQIAWQIAQALDFAHEHHIIHRDIKPANIMVETRPDGEVVARLLDFGLAAEIRSSMGRVSREIHDTSGTRPYMAPEQWTGRKQGPATDQYALAVLLYEMLMGEVPFASVFDTGDPMVMMNAVCSQEVEFPEDCPRQAALRRALAKDPSLRFASCMDFLDAVAEVQTSKSHGGLVLCVVVGCILVFGGLCCWLCLENIQAEKKYRKRQAEKQAELNAKEEMANVRRLPQQDKENWKDEEPVFEKYRRESTELTRIGNVIADRVGVAKRKAREAEMYRGDPVGFEKHLATIDAEAAKLNNIPEPKNVAEANGILKSVNDVACTISLEMDWLLNNKPLRESARRVEEEMKSGLDKELDRLEVSATCADIYSQGQALRLDGNAALEKGDFSLAREKLTKAKGMLTKSLDEAARKKREKELAEARGRAKKIEDEIERDIKPELDRLKAWECTQARNVYNEGARQLKNGKTCIEEGDYAAAEDCLAKAREKLSNAALTAKRYKIKQYLDNAYTWRSAGEWQQCVDECNAIFDLDAANVEAKNLKDDAENHLAQQAERREETVQKRKRMAKQPREQRQISGSVLANEFTIDDANTLSQLGPMLPLVRTHYERASEHAMKGSSHMSQAKSEYKKGRDYGGPEWPALEKWLKWWK